ncbi:hypothetical protein COT50_00665 [candidate division WWE3 bacterium CG08_land_8_20_14_0_20_41_10]|uniref:Uncharacterized protein n=1 Tax=candidate division WWE3 bacterium CG08_land_8_20_14_0_20_41_10 TaxID=1975085 RepID=A0A2H0XEX4_UNCKA|nr:MAG: hypothetical protein COT50_00665 [candidate division WWE3 bacterium CG08_land_8_20_14_0_20_41_10]
MNANELPPQVAWNSKDHDRERVMSIAGIDSLPISDEVRVQVDSAGNPQGLVETFSTDMLEENLATMESGKYALSKDIRDRATEEAVIKVLQEFGSYALSPELESLFPGLDKTAPENYRLMNSRLKIYIIPDLDFIKFDKAIHGTDYATGTAGFTAISVEPTQYPLAERVVLVNVGEKSLIVLSEGDPSNSYIGPIPPSTANTERLRTDIEHRVVHEVVHSFRVGNDLPHGLREGITEWYTQGIIQGDLTDENYFAKPDASLAYRYETEAVSLLLTAMLENGIELDKINKAFISRDKTAKIELSAFLASRYGLEEAQRIFDWRYRKGEQALKHIIGLEAKQESKLGDFLRAFANKDTLEQVAQDYYSE